MYSFSWLWFFVGLIVVAAGAAILKYYDKISDAMGTGVGGYQKWKLAAIIICAAGILMMFSLHTLVLNLIANLFFSGMRGN